MRVVNDTAMSVRDLTNVPFGIDQGAYEGRSSSLVLSRTSPAKKDAASNSTGPAANIEVGSQRVVHVKTIDIVKYLRNLHHAKEVAMQLDAEGSEFEMFRDLMLSGVLCNKIDNLWVDWHPGNRISWTKAGLPTSDAEMYKVYKWMLTSTDNSAKHRSGTADPDAHCKTVMFTIGER